MGCGGIATKFAKGLQLVPNAKLFSVGSRSTTKALEFASNFNANKAYGSYEELAVDPNVDIIYIATPHVYHCENTLLCLEHNKAVLCEKPFAINEKEVLRMVSKAREKQLFLMEAIWTRFFPIIEKTLEIIQSGKIGEVVHVRSDFGYKAAYDLKSRLFSPDLGGGSLLDIGIYPVFLSMLLLGEPDEISAEAALTSENIDETMAFTFKYPGNKIAQMFSTFSSNTEIEAHIYGTKGRIRIHRMWFMSRSLTITMLNDEQETITIDHPGDGYHYEAAEVNKCMQLGMLEHPKLSLDFSIKLIRILDNLRKLCSIKYPNE